MAARHTVPARSTVELVGSLEIPQSSSDFIASLFAASSSVLSHGVVLLTLRFLVVTLVEIPSKCSNVRNNSECQEVV